MGENEKNYALTTGILLGGIVVVLAASITSVVSVRKKHKETKLVVEALRKRGYEAMLEEYRNKKSH